jgi:amphi-Trp domain-containing protein
MKVEQKQALSRKEAARFLAALAQELEQDGRVTVALGSSTLEFSVASQLDCELEVSVDGGQIELELELKWSVTTPSSATQGAEEEIAEVAAMSQSAGAAPAEAQSAEAESANVAPAEGASAEIAPAEAESVEAESAEAEQGEAEAEEAVSAEAEPADAVSAEAESEQDDPDNGESPDASARDDGQDSGRPEDPAGSAEAQAGPAAKPTRSANRRRARRSASVPADKPAFNGVDTAAVRAWAAANGLTVSPRGRIKDEVIEAYRAAGN